MQHNFRQRVFRIFKAEEQVKNDTSEYHDTNEIEVQERKTEGDVNIAHFCISSRLELANENDFKQ